MDVTTYSNLALRTAPDSPRKPGTRDIEITGDQKQMLLMVLGLTGEAGEIAEMVKKHVFHGHPWDDEKVVKLIRELGDILWYINYGAVRVGGIGLEAVFDKNIDKLAARYPEGFFSSERSINRAAGDE